MSAESPVVPVRSASTKRRWIIVLVIALTTFVALAVAVKVGATAQPDRVVTTWFADGRTATGGHLGLLLATLTTPLVLVGLTVIIAVILWVRARRFEAIVLGLSVLIAYAIGGLMKVIEGRTRPGAPQNLAPEAEPSFPSGHVVVVSTLVLVSLVLAWGHLSRRGRVISSLLAGAAIVVISLDRLVVGAHWLTDVLASISLAVAITACAGIAVSRHADSSAASQPPISG